MLTRHFYLLKKNILIFVIYNKSLIFKQYNLRYVLQQLITFSELSKGDTATTHHLHPELSR